METCYLPFEVENWRSITAFEECTAMQSDVGRCNAVFATGEGQSEVVPTDGLPALAILAKDDGSKEQVVTIQIEKQVAGSIVIVGYVLPSGGTGIGTLPEFKIVEYSK